MILPNNEVERALARAKRKQLNERRYRRMCARYTAVYVSYGYGLLTFYPKRVKRIRRRW